MELQTSAFCSLPSGSDKRALPTIAHPDLPPDRRWNVAGSWCDAAARLWSSGRGPFGLLEVFDQHREGAIEDHGRVAGRNVVAQQVLSVPQLPIGLLAHRELDLVSRRRQRCDDGRARYCCRTRYSSLASPFSASCSAGEWTTFGSGSLRVEAGRSGFGRSLATMCSTSRRLWWRTVSSRVRWFSSVRCGPSSVTVVRVIEPPASRVQDLGKTARGAGGFDAAVGCVFGKMQHLRAIGEQRRAPLTQIELAGIELRERCDELRSRVSFLPRQMLHLPKQILIGHLIQRTDLIRHDTGIARRFLRARDDRCGANVRHITACVAAT